MLSADIYTDVHIPATCVIAIVHTCAVCHVILCSSDYIDRLTMPKLMITTGGDEFFQNDDSWYFWDSLKGEKFMRYTLLENTCKLFYCMQCSRSASEHINTQEAALAVLPLTTHPV